MHRELEQILYRLDKAHPHYPTTVSPCYRCNPGGDIEVNAGRGSDVCANCLEAELAEIVGIDKAHSYHAAVKYKALWWGILEDASAGTGGSKTSKQEGQ
jgi:hypothetical protein